MGWFTSLSVNHFDLKLTVVNEGTLNYYQERDPIKESFDIIYMDEYNIDIKIEGSKLVSLSLSKDKNTLAYESTSTNEKMKRKN